MAVEATAEKGKKVIVAVEVAAYLNGVVER